MHHPLPRPYLYSAYRVSADFDDFGIVKSRPGTAFFVRMPDDSYYLVTNRHVLDPTFDKGGAAAHWKLTGVSVYGFTFDVEHFVGRYSPVKSVHFPNDEVEDIAILKVENMTVEPAMKTVHINAIPYEQLADAKYFESLNCGDFVSMPGYPEWYDHSADRPILRSGTLASDPKMEYCGPDQKRSSSRRLIEAFSYGGSSGSPVFALGYGALGSSDIIISGSRPLKLIGINAGHLKVGGSGGHSGLSFMFTSIALAELLNKASQLAKH